ncbi:hypothetical protein GR160_00340 [Flavobacterium sp. Sd200]|uniref:lipoprotein n=1 Tax=Flavobacterium sp. Sd200 TaxID=2692211 RepID=UPI0013718CF4|nr:lipoprotein [Flavobacterium sp. Sd200]MXN89663.1 hypothetical protein [Flavobacterium sp. Sd200]
MKKILLLFTLTGLLTLTGCNNDDDVVVANTSNETFEIGGGSNPINFTNDVDTYLYTLDPAIGQADVVLIYRLVSDPYNAPEDIWEPVPTTYEFEGGDKLSYNTDFTRNSIAFYLNANFDLAQAPDYALDQYFRVVILKGFDNSANRVDLRDYNSVVKRYNVVESNRGNSTRK